MPRTPAEQFVVRSVDGQQYVIETVVRVLPDADKRCERVYWKTGGTIIGERMPKGLVASTPIGAVAAYIAYQEQMIERMESALTKLRAMFNEEACVAEKKSKWFRKVHREPDPKQAEIERLRDLLTDAGICATCGKELVWDGEGPWLVCDCGTTEWTAPLPTIAQLREDAASLGRALFGTAMRRIFQMTRDQYDALRRDNPAEFKRRWLITKRVVYACVWGVNAPGLVKMCAGTCDIDETTAMTLLDLLHVAGPLDGVPSDLPVG